MKDKNWYRQALENEHPGWVEEIYWAEIGLMMAGNENIPVTREERDINKGATCAALEKAGIEIDGQQGGFQEGDRQYLVRMSPKGDELVLESMDAGVSLQELRSRTGEAFVAFDDGRQDTLDARFDYLSAARRSAKEEYVVVKRKSISGARKEFDRALDYEGRSMGFGAKDVHKPELNIDVFDQDISLEPDEYIEILEEAGYRVAVIEGENRPEMYGRMIEYVRDGLEQDSFTGEDSDFFP